MCEEGTKEKRTDMKLGRRIGCFSERQSIEDETASREDARNI